MLGVHTRWHLLLPLFQQCLLSERAQKQQQDAKRDRPADPRASWDAVCDLVALGLTDEAAASVDAMPATAFAVPHDRAILLVCRFTPHMHTSAERIHRTLYTSARQDALVTMPRLETSGSVRAFHDAWCLWSEECAAARLALATPACARIAALLAGDARAFVAAPGTPRHALQTLLYRDPLRTRSTPDLLAPLPQGAPAPRSFPEAALRALLAHGAPHAVALAAHRVGDWFAAFVGTLLLRPGVLDATRDDEEEEHQLLRLLCECECESRAVQYAVGLVLDTGAAAGGGRHRAVGSALLCGPTAVAAAHVFARGCSVAFVVRALEAAVLGVDDPHSPAARALAHTALRTLLAADDALAPAEAASVGARLGALSTRVLEKAQGTADRTTAAVLGVLGGSLFAGPEPRAPELVTFLGDHTHGVPLDVRVAALRCLARRLRACAPAREALRTSPAGDVLWVLVEQYAEEAAAAVSPLPPEADATALLDDVLALRL